MPKITLENKQEVEISQERYDEFVKESESPKRWRAKKGEKYFHVSVFSEVSIQIESFDVFDDFYYNTGNYFKTEEEAKHHGKVLLASQRIRDIGDEIDWENKGAYIICSDHDYQRFVKKFVGFKGTYLAYFATEEKAEEILENKEIMSDYALVMGIDQCKKV